MPPEISLPLEQPCPVTDALAAWRAIADLPYPFLLHSSLPGARARWSFFGADPFSIYRGGDYGGGVAAFRRLARRAQASQALGDAPGGPRAPFTGGAVGYWSYDFGRRLEHGVVRVMRGSPRTISGCPIFCSASTTWSARSIITPGRRGSSRAACRSRAIAAASTRAVVWSGSCGCWSAALESSHAEPARPATVSAARSNFRPGEYCDAVHRLQEHIRSGDIFQANLSQRWTLPVESPDPERMALALHESLALHSPAPFAALLGGEDHAVVSASPERFLEIRGARVESRPIKGTRPRHADPAVDARLAEELTSSAKDRAENVMIVDVLRNDLGRVCESGSVTVPELCALESFPQVHHLTSTVTGTLAEGRDAFDLLHACFPGGSITGAPKMRAMELLDVIEPQRRHVYTGSIGYLDWRGDADWNIAIRTALVTT